MSLNFLLCSCYRSFSQPLSTAHLHPKKILQAFSSHACHWRNREGGFSFTNFPSKGYAFLSLWEELTMPGNGAPSPTGLAHAPHILSSSRPLSKVEMQHTEYKPKQMLCYRFYGSSLLLSLGPEAVLPTYLPLIGELPEADGKALQCQEFEGHS